MEANAGEYSKNYLHLKRFPHISLHCKLVPIQYWEYEYGLFKFDTESVYDCMISKNNERILISQRMLRYPA